MELTVLTIFIGVVHSTPSLVCDGFREQMVQDFSENLPIKTLLRRNIRNLEETDCVFFFRTTDIYNQAEAYPFLVQLQAILECAFESETIRALLGLDSSGRVCKIQRNVANFGAESKIDSLMTPVPNHGYTDKTFVYGSVSVDYRFKWIWNMLEVGDFEKDLRKCVGNVERLAKRTRALSCKRRASSYKCKGFEAHKFKELPQNPPIRGLLRSYIGNIADTDCVFYYRAKMDRQLPFFPFLIQLQNKTSVYGTVTVDYQYHWSWHMSEVRYFEKDLEKCSADFETVAKRGLSCSHTSQDKAPDHSIFVIKKLRHDTISF